ncbi:MAG: hypothetical protein JSV10_08925, partial [Candidatus Zixiibacteriota bacterium]
MRKANIKASRSTSVLPLLTFPLVLLFLVAPLLAQAQETPEVEGVSAQEIETVPPAPPANVQAEDNPNDKGGIINRSWERSPDDGARANNVTGYEI